MKYQNLSRTTRKIHGVTLKPQEIKEIPGVVNDKDLIRIVEKKSYSKPTVKVSSKQKDESIKQETQPPVENNTSQEVNKANG